VTAAQIDHNSIRLTARAHTLAGNEVAVSSNGLLVGGPFLEGGAPLTAVQITAIEGGVLSNPIGTTLTPDAPPWGNWGVPTLTGAESYTQPACLFEWPLVGIHAQGQRLNINNVHIEGTGIGINVVQSSSTSSVTISNVDVYALMDASMRYRFDPAYFLVEAPAAARQLATYPDNAISSQRRYWNYSCGVLISSVPGGYSGAHNLKDAVVITNLKVVEVTKYALRDAVYGVDVRSTGHGQLPSDGSMVLAFYARGNAYAPAVGVAPNAAGGGTFATHPAAKQYFIGPVI
jgi:hypothetical protein